MRALRRNSRGADSCPWAGAHGRIIHPFPRGSIRRSTLLGTSVHPTGLRRRGFAPDAQLSGGQMATNPNVKAIREQEKELVSVFETADETEAMVVQGLLESNGIDSLLANLEAPQDVLPGVGGVALRVRPSEADEAREIIREQRNAPPSPEESTGTEIA